MLLRRAGAPAIASFFFKGTATTAIYTLSLHDALPISRLRHVPTRHLQEVGRFDERDRVTAKGRSEEHTSELQSHSDLVCRLLLEKKKHAAADRGIAHRAHHVVGIQRAQVHALPRQDAR